MIKLVEHSGSIVQVDYLGRNIVERWITIYYANNTGQKLISDTVDYYYPRLEKGFDRLSYETIEVLYNNSIRIIVVDREKQPNGPY